MNESLGKEYKLCSKKAIDRLFKEGNSFRCDGLRFIYVYHQLEDKEFKILFSVSKRNFKRAVDRNLLKRRMREAFRKNKTDLVANALNSQREVHIGMVYNQNKIISFHEIEAMVIKGLKILNKKLNEIHE